MYCYKCGCELGRSNHCPNCGADVTDYKRIIYTSNRLYNDGLEKAQVRDLSGAILSLKQAVWMNKDNLDARNLLGLIYYEIGETVAALAQWVISQNINNARYHLEDNLGDEYLTQVQNSRQEMENINTSIHRYNHAIDCCQQGSLDVAVIELKKVLSLNPHFLRARQLLALLYMNQRNWKRAEKELQKCLRLDINNTTTLRYLNEVESALSPAAGEERARARKAQSTKKKNGAGGGVVKYRADNETIIQPVGSKVPQVDGFQMPSGITGAVIGFIVGAAIIAFLVMPARVQSIRSESQSQVRTITEQAQDKDAQIADLQSQVDTLTSAAESSTAAESEESSQNETMQKIDDLMQTAAAYVNDASDTQTQTSLFVSLDPSTASEGESDAFSSLYNSLYAKLQSPMLERYAWAGIDAYEAQTPDYATAITDLEIANRYEDSSAWSMTYVQRLYYLGNSYYQVYLAADDEQKSGEYADYPANAAKYLQMVTDDFPDSDYAGQAAETLALVNTLDIPAQSVQEASTEALTESPETGASE